MGKLNAFIKLMGKVGIQVLYSVGIYTIALGMSGILCFLALVVMQVGGHPLTFSIWKIWFLVAIPIWFCLELYVNYHVWKILHGDK